MFEKKSDYCRIIFCEQAKRVNDWIRVLTVVRCEAMLLEQPRLFEHFPDIVRKLRALSDPQSAPSGASVSKATHMPANAADMRNKPGPVATGSPAVRTQSTKSGGGGAQSTAPLINFETPDYSVGTARGSGKPLIYHGGGNLNSSGGRKPQARP
jgi:hypothetical protein